jgi:hypothetical protein
MANTLTSHSPDRRTVRQYDLSVPIEVRATAEQSGLVRTTTRDVSSRGVYFVLDQKLSPSAEVDFRLTLPSELTRGPSVFVYAHGKVVPTDARTEDGAERVGIGASIETYDFIRVKASSR